MSKTKKLILIFTIIGLLVAGGIAGIVVWQVKINQKLETPVVSVYDLSDRTYVMVDKNEKAVSYQFFIRESGNTSYVAPITTMEPYLEISTYLKQPKSYEISAKYLGKTNNATSLLSETYVFKNYVKLQEPTIVVNKLSGRIEWASVDNAGKYILYYGANSNGEMQSITINKTFVSNVFINFKDPDKTKSLFDITGIGTFNISVMAVPNDGDIYFTNSELSNRVIVTNNVELSPVQLIKYSDTTNTLTFTASVEKVPTKNFKIEINGYAYYYYATEIAANHSINLDVFTKEEILVISITALGDGINTTDSPVQTWVKSTL